MELHPGHGVPLVALGADRRRVESQLGLPSSTRDNRSYYDDHEPALVVDYGTGDTVELIEIAYSGTPAREVTLRGIQLTYRPIDDVAADLEAAGYVGHPSDIGYDYEEGFAIWSMGSLSLADITPPGSTDDGRNVVEGVSVLRPELLPPADAKDCQPGVLDLGLSTACALQRCYCADMPPAHVPRRPRWCPQDVCSASPSISAAAIRSLAITS